MQYCVIPAILDKLIMFVTKTTVCQMYEPTKKKKKEREKTEKEAQAVNRAEKVYIKHCLFAVFFIVLCFAHSLLAKMMCR